MQQIKIGLIGFGTVGAGLVDSIGKNGDLIAKRCGVLPIITRIADLDIVSDRGVTLPEGVVLDTDAMALIASPDVEVVVELVGGTGAAKQFIEAALKLGKPVVTANKALLATHGEQLFALAKEKGGEIYFEASAGGGIPCIKALREGLIGNRIKEIYAILNGTCNYILSVMESDSRDFEQVLKEAQAAGYAEADPSMDVDGVDTAHKAAILASLVFGQWFTADDVDIDGIRQVTLNDIHYAASLGYKIKLLAIIKERAGRIQLSVNPSLIPRRSMLGHVNGVYNAVWVNGDIVGTTLYYGRGAGREATSSAVLADIIDVALNLRRNCSNRLPAFPIFKQYQGLINKDELLSRFYLRLQVIDQPGMLAIISGILGKYKISIASVTQKEEIGEKASVPMIILTHQAKNRDMRMALNEISQEKCVLGEPVLFHIEDLD
ncbi:MAG: homoserine dehydrogenase [Oligosphaeraceae bacterium]|nr:homoserine dehydrogenase [Oligosphaeraceae bacterium]